MKKTYNDHSIKITITILIFVVWSSENFISSVKSVICTTFYKEFREKIC